MKYTLPLFWGMLLSLLPPVLSATTVYQSTDEKGKKHFSDVPSTIDAQSIEYPSSQSYPPPSKPAYQRRTMKSNEESRIFYTLAITSPLQGEYILYSTEALLVKVQVTPALQAGYQIQLIADEQPITPANRTGIFSLPPLLRGEHTLSAQLIDEKGKTISGAKAPEITFYQQRFFKH